MAKHLERTCQVRNRVRQSRTLGSVGEGLGDDPSYPAAKGCPLYYEVGNKLVPMWYLRNIRLCCSSEKNYITHCVY